MAGSTATEGLVENRHDTATNALIAGFAVLFGLYGSWMFADFLPRAVGFALPALVGAFACYRRADRGSVAAAGCYGLAVLVVLTPFALQLPYVLNGGMVSNGGALSFFQPMDLVFLLIFLVIAAVPALVGFYLNNRGNVRERVGGAVGRVVGRVRG
ncbi:hypothetical protein [Haloglomus litoreum]|uniref:hypothetical protein n=1 Tax=Haloglomus litoreum TaxID=3034026 RepID=UPI0023E7F32B|nr:hypothetical protein [Haloglomus sp. DT116]